MARFPYFPAFLSLIFAGMCGSSVQAQQASTNGWVEHKDPLGFVVRTPQGWGVTTVDEGRIVIHSADKSVFVVVQPFLLKKATHAEDQIDTSLQQMQMLLPEAEIQQKKQLHASNPDEAAATANYTVNGKPGQTNLLCSIVGGNGMLYAIAAPQNVFAAKKPTLLNVLHSFHFVQPTAHVGSGATPGTAGKDSAAISYTTWADPKEHAFTEEVPNGWKTEGGLLRMSQVETRTQVVTVSPDGQMRLQVGDSTVPAFTLPKPGAEEFHRRFPLVPQGPAEGQTIKLPTGLTSIVMHYRTGADFSHLIAQLKFGKQHPELKIEESTELTPPANQQVSGAGNSTLTAGATRFTFQENGRDREGFVYSSTRLMPFPNPALGGTWYCAQLLIGTYPSGANLGPKALTILEHMSNTTVNDPQWYQRQYNTTASATNSYVASVTKQMNAAHAAFMKQLDEQGEKNRTDFAERMHAKDETNRHETNMILGQTDVRDPITGRTYKVASGHNYYWADPADQNNASHIVGQNVYERPDINFTPLEEW